MRKIGTKVIYVLAVVVCLASLVGAISFFLGYSSYYQYQMARQEIKSLEKDFPDLERKLKQGVHFYPLPLFYEQLGRLRLERALAEIEFGIPEKSDGYLDEAREALITAIKGNPVDYPSFWELAKVYFLYNYPLPTYAQKGRDFCREAIRRYPCNEFLNLNVLFVFFSQWSLLEENERDWLRERIQNLSASNPRFLDKLKNKWRENHKEAADLEIRLKNLGL